MGTAVMKQSPLCMDNTHDPQTRFRSVYREHSNSVLGYALRRVDDATDAADVLAETFLVAWRRIEDLPPSDEVRPWLFGVARRVLANRRRGDHRRHRLAERMRKHLATTTTFDPPDDPTTGHLVQEALGRLGEDDQEMLRLTSWEGLEPAELAVMWGIPPATVRTRLHRARNRLRTELTSLGWPIERSDASGHEPNTSPPITTLTHEEDR